MDIQLLIEQAAPIRVNAVAIVAVDKHFGIGIGDKLPDFPKLDLHWFKHNTLNKVCVVGSKTFAGLPKLKDRKFVVITRNVENWTANNNGPNAENVVGCMSDICQALDNAKCLAFANGQTEVMVIGGAEIYNYCFANKLVNEVLLSQIWSDQHCDKLIDPDALRLNYQRRLMSDRRTMADGKNMVLYKYTVI